MTSRRSRKKQQQKSNAVGLFDVFTVCICVGFLFSAVWSGISSALWPTPSHGLSKREYLAARTNAVFFSPDGLDHLAHVDQTIVPPFELDPLVGQCIEDPCVDCPHHCLWCHKSVFFIFYSATCPMFKLVAVLLCVFLVCVAADINDDHLQRLNAAIGDLESMFDEAYTVERFEHGVQALREGHGEATIKVAAVRENTVRKMFELVSITVQVLNTSTASVSELHISLPAKCATSSE